MINAAPSRWALVAESRLIGIELDDEGCGSRVEDSLKLLRVFLGDEGRNHEDTKTQGKAEKVLHHFCFPFALREHQRADKRQS